MRFHIWSWLDGVSVLQSLVVAQDGQLRRALVDSRCFRRAEPCPIRVEVRVVHCQEKGWARKPRIPRFLRFAFQNNAVSWNRMRI